MDVIVGWDVGGAHLKAARVESGRVVTAVQVAAPLRFGLDRMIEAFAEARAAIGPADEHAVTMTGELADTFARREEGVAQLTALAVRALAPEAVRLYAGPAGFVAPARAGELAGRIASANWHATATLVALRCHDALLIDVGSTTTDVVPLRDGAVAARGYTDAERLAAGELIYTGLVRSFLMAVAARAPFAGRWTTLVNENFATMADVHRLLGTLPDGVDQMPTADGRPKTVAASRARLARMVGTDADAAADDDWTRLAAWFAEAQLRTIVDGTALVETAARLPPDAPVVGAGIGEAVVREVARRLGRRPVDISTVIEAAPEARDGASRCAPAAAVALLRHGEIGG